MAPGFPWRSRGAPARPREPPLSLMPQRVYIYYTLNSMTVLSGNTVCATHTYAYLTYEICTPRSRTQLKRDVTKHTKLNVDRCRLLSPVIIAPKFPFHPATRSNRVERHLRRGQLFVCYEPAVIYGYGYLRSYCNVIIVRQG